MKRTTPWIVALACLTTIGGSLWAASEMNLAPWAAPAPAPAPTPKQLTVTAAPTDSVADTGGTVTLTFNSDTAWSASSNATWAAVSPTSGPKGAGSVTVTVAANTTSSPRTATIEVYATDSTALKQTITINQKAQAPANKPITALTISKEKDTVDIGGTIALNVTITPSDATNKTLTWTSSNTSVVAAPTSTTTSMTAIASAAGNTTITVTTTDGSNLTKTCNVHVRAATVPVTGVNITPEKDTVVLGSGNRTITAAILPAGATNQDVTWTSLIRTYRHRDTRCHG